MKIFKIVFISFLGLIVLTVIATVIFIKTFDVNRYKPQITSEAAKAMSRGVDFRKADLGISLTQGISLKISDLSIAEDPEFGKGNFFSVKEISVGVDAFGYIFRKRVEISSIIINSPQITIIRKKDGSINVQTIAKPAQAGKQLLKSSPAAAAVAIPAIMISTIKAFKGTVNYIDYSFDPPVRLEVKELNSTVSKVSLTQVFPFTVSAAVLSDKENVSIEGKVSFDLKTNQMTIFELKGVSELAEILMAKVPAAFPMAKGAVLPNSLKGSLNFNLDKVIAGPEGLKTLAGESILTNGSLQFKELVSPVLNIEAKAKITEKNIVLETASAKINEGLITASGSLEDYPASQQYSAGVEIKDLKLQDMVSQDNSPVKVEGVVSGKAKVKGSGFTPEALKTALSGSADISIVQAKFKDMNVLRTVLDKISLIPGLSQRIEAGLPDKYQKKLIAKDTALSDIKLPVVIENGRLVITDLSVGADEFIFKGSGQAGISGSYSLEGLLLIPSDLSAAMVSQVSELQYLLNEEKQILIPLKISGKAGEMKFNVDGQYIAQKLVQNQLKQQIFKALEKSGGSQGSATGTSEEQSSAGQQGSDKSSTEEAVGSLLRGIFKK
ncbi:MAG: AsmA family protein [Candidatus Omnitrophica bacterium]|nr:AsmA family protein [Candidatus Omnitrophota bacterium]